MKLLLHVCCGPCALFPVSVLRESGISFTSYFYNPNIHPYKEFQRRIEAITIVSKYMNFELIVDKKYGLIEFLRNVVYKEKTRCDTCYDLRLTTCFKFAQENGFDSFSTTLLYSRYQNHNLIVKKCNDLSNEFGIKFIYNDFRKGWMEGINQSKSLNIYRQRYCGCIYSEQEAFDKSLRNKK